MLDKRQFYSLYDILDDRKLMEELNPRNKRSFMFTSFLQRHAQNRQYAYSNFWQPYRTTLNSLLGLCLPLMPILVIAAWEGVGPHALWLLLTPVFLVVLAYVEYRIRTPAGRREREAFNRLAEIAGSTYRAEDD